MLTSLYGLMRRPEELELVPVLAGDVLAGDVAALLIDEVVAEPVAELVAGMEVGAVLPVDIGEVPLLVRVELPALPTASEELLAPGHGPCIVHTSPEPDGPL